MKAKKNVGQKSKNKNDEKKSQKLRKSRECVIKNQS
jgi:hypothetical protein